MPRLILTSADLGELLLRKELEITISIGNLGKLTQAEKREIKASTGKTLTSIAAAYGVSVNTVWKIKKGITKVADE